MFKPENDLERAMQAAVGDPDKIPDFYKILLDSEVYVLTPETKMEPGRRRSMKYNEPINVATVTFQGLRWHPAFTSKARISDYIKDSETCLGAKARDLLPMLRDSNIWLNPLSECQKPMPAAEIALLLSGKIYDKFKRAS